MEDIFWKKEIGMENHDKQKTTKPVMRKEQGIVETHFPAARAGSCGAWGREQQVGRADREGRNPCPVR